MKNTIFVLIVARQRYLCPSVISMAMIVFNLEMYPLIWFHYIICLNKLFFNVTCTHALHCDISFQHRIPMHAVKLDGVTLAVPQSPARFLSQLSQSRYIPCNETRAKEFVTTYPQNTNERDQVMALLFKKRVRHLLAMTKQILDELHIPFWISSGTCLGNDNVNVTTTGLKIGLSVGFL